MVKLHEYTESEEQFVLFMEYANDAEYFDNKIVEVSLSLFDLRKKIFARLHAVSYDDHHQIAKVLALD